LEWRLVLIVHSDHFRNSIFPGGMTINTDNQPFRLIVCQLSLHFEIVLTNLNSL
jgi:hypothetical protein